MHKPSHGADSFAGVGACRVVVDNGIGWHDKEFTPWPGAKGAKEGDTVAMRLDLTKGKLEVLLNGESLGMMPWVIA
jgi:hypothetical protein